MQFEINLKNISEIAQISDYPAEFRINNLCLVDKPKALDNLVVAEQLLIRQPNLQLTLNFAVVNHLSCPTNL